MARVVVYSLGYRGDVFPYVPIASELAARGHEVTYVVPPEFHALLGGEGFRCVHSGLDLGPALLDEHAKYVAHFGGARMIPVLIEARDHKSVEKHGDHPRPTEMGHVLGVLVEESRTEV